MNITYLLGAGASYKALPILNELPERLIEFRSEIRFASNKGVFGKFDNLLDDLGWLINEVDKHQTIDTLARRLFLNSDNHGKLIKLKALLIVYFLFEQTSTYTNRFRGANNTEPTGLKEDFDLIDKRYDSFIATIISDKIDSFELNQSIKVLTWNYDCQFELAYNRFVERPIGLDDMQVHLQMKSEQDIYSAFDISRFGLLKLNGSASFSDGGKNFFDKINLVNIESEYYSEIADTYHKCLEDEKLLEIRYAWESQQDNRFRSPHSKRLVENLKMISETTDILVVIGYSFPIFNRKVDKQIIDSMSNLRKVYVQDKFPDRVASIMQTSFERLQQRNNGKFPEIDVQFEGKSWRNVEFYTESNIDSFLLPPELN